MPVPAIFYPHRRESPVKSTNQVGRFYHMIFQNGGWQRHLEPANKVEVPHRRDWRKNRQVCLHPVGGENRVRFSMAIKFAAIGESNRQVCRRLYAHRRESPVKSTNQVGRFYISHDFSKWRIAAALGAWEQG